MERTYSEWVIPKDVKGNCHTGEGQTPSFAPCVLTLQVAGLAEFRPRGWLMKQLRLSTTGLQVLPEKTQEQGNQRLEDRSGFAPNSLRRTGIQLPATLFLYFRGDKKGLLK